MTAIEAIEVESDQRARIVVSERTGTVVAGDRVRIHAVAVAHGGLSISIMTNPLVSQPGPLSRGRTVQANQATVDAKEKKGPVVALPATTTVEELVKALNLIGASPRDLIAILQAMKAAGAIDADLDVI
jgi:flagellar P-ring protein precursor FlgI